MKGEDFVNKIICHDVAKPLPLPDGCIDVIFTSPPYWGLRNYGEDVVSIFDGDPDCEHVFSEYDSKLLHENRQNLNGGTIGSDKFREKLHGFGNAKAGFCSKCGAWKGQLGLEPHPQMFIDHLVNIFREAKRVLKKSGSFYLNLGDTYCGYYGENYGYSHSFNRLNGNEKEQDSPPPKKSPKMNGKWLQPKQLMGMPWRVATSLQEDGWVLRNCIIWHKPNPMPSSAKDRLANTYEFLFFFVKKPRGYYYDLDAIREPHKELSLLREKYGFDQIPRAWQNGSIPIPGGKDVNIRNYPAGKNPGDVINIKSSYFQQIQDNKFMTETEKDDARRSLTEVLKSGVDFRMKLRGTHKITHSNITELSGRQKETDNKGFVILKVSEKGKNPGDVLTWNYRAGMDRDESEIIEVRIEIPLQKEFVDYLKPKIKGFEKELDDIFTETKWRHWIRYDVSGFAFPSIEDWKKLKELLDLDDTFDLTKTELKYNDVRNNYKGKNPGDILEYDTKYKNDSHGQTLQGFARNKTIEQSRQQSRVDAKVLFPNNKKAQQEYINIVHDHDGTLSGKNPGDVSNWDEHDLNEDGNPRVSTLWKSAKVPRTTHSLGKAPGDFWDVCTQAFTAYNPDLEHFAVFPEELVIKPLMASCPKEICMKCGKAKYRITDNSPPTDTEGWGHPTKQHTKTPTSTIRNKKGRMGRYNKKTIKRSDCGCNAGFKPGIVLDPFCGRGTVGKVARDLGLNYVLFDIKPEYCELARLFIAGQKHKIHKDQIKLKGDEMQ